MARLEKAVGSYGRQGGQEFEPGRLNPAVFNNEEWGKYVGGGASAIECGVHETCPVKEFYFFLETLKLWGSLRSVLCYELFIDLDFVLTLRIYFQL